MAIIFDFVWHSHPEGLQRFPGDTEEPIVVQLFFSLRRVDELGDVNDKLDKHVEECETPDGEVRAEGRCPHITIVIFSRGLYFELAIHTAV